MYYAAANTPLPPPPPLIPPKACALHLIQSRTCKVWTCREVFLPLQEQGEEQLLSGLQLESIFYACQRHDQILADGNRAGFMVGDGAGVGKGRTIAGPVPS